MVLGTLGYFLVFVGTFWSLLVLWDTLGYFWGTLGGTFGYFWVLWGTVGYLKWSEMAVNGWKGLEIA